MNTRSQRIYKAISDSGLSYGQLSQITKIPKSALQRYATGETEKVPIDRVQMIAKATHVTAAYLMGWEDNLETNTDFIAEMMMDSSLIEHVKMLLSLDEENKKTIYNMIEFLTKKEGP